MNIHPYADAKIAFATMHGKEQLARQPFLDTLRADVIAPAGLDTDQFGTFSGEIARTLSPRAAARVKARLGIQLAGTPYGLASEGSFGSGLGFLVEHREVLMFLDDARGLELVEGTVVTSPLPPGRAVTAVDDALAYATGIGHPEQGVLIRGGPTGDLIQKDVDTGEELSDTLGRMLRLTTGHPVTISPDYRAHRCPSRAETIITLAHRMARRLTTHCPHCHTPGFGQVDIERGLRCSDCGQPTRMIAADILGCGLCSHTVRTPRTNQIAAPQWCDYCNP